jgi:GNAT superfamily N-acetyltransferase
MTVIRSARSDDTPRICELLTQLGYPADLAHVTQRLASLNDDSTSAVLVAEMDGIVLGVISLHAFDLFHQAGRIGRITALVVEAASQRKGIGASLLAAADEFFRRVGCIRAEVTSGDHRTGAHAFYESRGYLSDERRFLKRYDS